MRRIIALAVLVIAAALSTLGQTGSPNDEQRNKTIEEVKKAMSEVGDAISHHDEAALKRLLADDYIFTHSTGNVDDKTQRISSLMSNDLVVQSQSSSDFQIRVYGDVVVTTHLGRQKSQFQGVDREIQIRGISVWVKQQGRWQVVAQQSTRVQPERRAIALDPKVLDLYVGQYEIPPDRHYTITREGTALIARGGQREFTLIPESETKFFVEGLDAHWTFYKDNQSMVSEVGVRIGTGQEMRGKKVK